MILLNNYNRKCVVLCGSINCGIPRKTRIFLRVSCLISGFGLMFIALELQ
jgi:hypothetical protein